MIFAGCYLLLIQLLPVVIKVIGQVTSLSKPLLAGGSDSHRDGVRNQRRLPTAQLLFKQLADSASVANLVKYHRHHPSKFRVHDFVSTTEIAVPD